MILNQLAVLPSEDQLSDFVVSIFKRNPNLIPLFAKSFSVTPIPDNRFDIFSRKQLSAIPDISPGSFGKLKPDIIMSNKTHLIVFENKRDAALKPNQLPDYIQAVQGLKMQKSIQYFLIAPRTSKYVNLPNEVCQVTWDQLFDFLLANNHDSSENELNTLGRFRLFFFQKIYDEILTHLRGEFSGLPYASDKPTSDYYGVHFTLPQSDDVVFSLAIFLQSPSYLKLFPFKVKHRGTLLKFNENNPIVQNYKTALFRLPRTEHKLKTSLPGYVIDLFPYPANDIITISQEVQSLLNNECRQMIAEYNSMR